MALFTLTLALVFIVVVDGLITVRLACHTGAAALGVIVDCDIFKCRAPLL